MIHKAMITKKKYDKAANLAYFFGEKKNPSRLIVYLATAGMQFHGNILEDNYTYCVMMHCIMVVVTNF